MKAARELLDRLMGENRNGDRNESLENIKFTDPRVCKEFLVGLCTEELSTNSRARRTCSLLHRRDLKEKYDKDPNKWSYGYADQLIDRLRGYDADRRHTIEEQRRRLSKDGGEPVLIKTEDNENVKSIAEEIKRTEILRQEYIDKKKEAAVDECTLKLDKLRTSKAQTQAKIVQEMKNVLPEGTDHTNAKKHQENVICDICGGSLSIFDSDIRLTEHFSGKIHNSYLQALETLERLTAERKEYYASRASSSVHTRSPEGGDRRIRDRNESSREDRRRDDRRREDRRRDDRRRDDRRRSRSRSRSRSREYRRRDDRRR